MSFFINVKSMCKFQVGRVLFPAGWWHPSGGGPLLGSGNFLNFAIHTLKIVQKCWVGKFEYLCPIREMPRSSSY